MNVVDYVLLYISPLTLKEILPANELFTARYLFRAVPEIGDMFVSCIFLWRELGTEANRLSHGM